MAAKPVPVQGFFKSDTLATLGAELDKQSRLLRLVREGLPEFLATHCGHCVPKGERLLIYADSPAFASQLRFYGPGLLVRLEQAGQRFRDVQVHNLLPVSVGFGNKPGPEIKPPNPRVADMLRESAENAPDEIGEALLRLSRTLEKAR